MSRLLLDQGVTPGSRCVRDRNRVVLEQGLRGLRFTGAKTVFCVTGDSRGYDVRADVTQTFDLDGPRLVALAASLDMVAAVPETPTAPPTHIRAAGSSRNSEPVRVWRCSTTCRLLRRCRRSWTTHAQPG